MVTLPDILDKAKEFVTGDKQDQYGDPAEMHARIARLWQAYLESRRDPAAPLAGRDVAAMMALLKLARMEGGKFSEDHAIDMAAYVAIMGALDAPADPPA